LTCSPGDAVEYDSFALLNPLVEFVDDLGVVSVVWFEYADNRLEKEPTGDGEAVDRAGAGAGTLMAAGAGAGTGRRAMVMDGVFLGRGGRDESRGRGLLAAMADASLTSSLGGGRGGPVWIWGRSFSAGSDGFGLSILLEAAWYLELGAGELGSPMCSGGSCGGSDGSEGASDGRPDLFDLLNLRSRKEGGAGSALEKRDRPVIGA